jgi:hypothetical protein
MKEKLLLVDDGCKNKIIKLGHNTSAVWREIKV